MGAGQNIQATEGNSQIPLLGRSFRTNDRLL